MDLLDTVNVAMDSAVDAHMDIVDVATAAQRLGVPVATVYKRIQRGRLRVHRGDGHVYVVLDRSMDASTPSMDPASNGHGPDGPPSMDTANGHVDGAEQVVGSDNLAPLVAQLQSENVWLRGELEARRRECDAWHDRLREAHLVQA